MKCEDALPLINAWVDREIADEDRVALESHFGACEDCQAIADELRLADSDLTRAFESDRDAARDVASAVISSLPSLLPPAGGEGGRRPDEGGVEGEANAVSPESSSPSPALRAPSPPQGREGTVLAREESRPVDWRSLAMAVVVGFLLALVIFPPSAHQNPGPPTETAGEEVERPKPGPDSESPRDNGFSRIATLVAATGDVQFASGTGSWRDASTPLIQCPSDGKVRTAKGARAELVTSDGAVIRMNGDTEVTLKSSREVELQKGQVFCRAPDDVGIEVFSCERPSSPSTQPPTQKVSWAASGSGKGFLSSVSPEGAGQVVTPPGSTVSLKTESGRHELKSGQSATIINGQVQPGGLGDPLLAASWIHPLLIRKGHNDPELKERVDELLAQIGHNKMSMLYEREIRSLGEHCVLPLIRYVQSPISMKEPGRRGSAMSIVADLAPSLVIEDLISLLKDESPEVRYQAAGALFRLTGETLERSPDDWRKPLSECQETIETWSAWWQTNRGRFPRYAPQKK